MTRSRFPLAILLPCLALLLLCTAAAAAHAPVLEGKVVWVYDGDTLKIDGLGKVRLVGIDTPEKENSARDKFYQQWRIPPSRLRHIAHQAMRFCIEQAKGTQVVLIPAAEQRDRHGRLLAYVRLPDGRLLNRLLIEQGLATVYRRYDFRLKEDFLAAETAARRKGLGLWQQP